MRIAVTGGAGFIGSHVCRRLAASGHEIVVLDSLATGRRENLVGIPHQFLHGSILDEGALDEAFAGCQAVVHLAALVSVPASLADPEKARTDNDEGTRLTIRAAVEAGVTRFVQASTSAVYGPDPLLPSREDGPVAPASPYASSKLAAEAHAQQASEQGLLEACSLRLFNVYGQGQDPSSPYSGVISILMDRGLRSEPFRLFGDGSQTRDFIHASEAAEAVEKAVTVSDPPLVVNVATGKAITLLQLIAAMEKALGRRLEVVREEDRPGDVRLSQADVTLASASLGFRAKIGIEEGLKMTLAPQASAVSDSA